MEKGDGFVCFLVVFLFRWVPRETALDDIALVYIRECARGGSIPTRKTLLQRKGPKN